MTLEEFCLRMKEEVERLLDGNSRVEIRQVQKNNVGVVPTMNIIEGELPVSMNFYMKDLYGAFREQGKTMEELAEGLVQVHCENIGQCQELDISKMFGNPEQVREILFFRLVNYEKNRELLENVPHVKVLDLALVYYLLADRNGDRIGSMRTSHRMFWHFGWDAEKMQGEVMDNTVRLFPEHIMPLYHVLEDMKNKAGEEQRDLFEDMLDETVEKDFPLLLSNSSRVNGATVIAYPNLLQRVAEEVGFNLFLLPSSVHEFLALPDDGRCSLDDLERMVAEVNRSSVQDEEKLSDHVYYYDAGADRLMIAGGSAEDGATAGAAG